MLEQLHVTLLILDYLKEEETDIHDWEVAIDAFIEVYKNGDMPVIVISVLQEEIQCNFVKS